VCTYQGNNLVDGYQKSNRINSAQQSQDNKTCKPIGGRRAWRTEKSPMVTFGIRVVFHLGKLICLL